MDETRTEYRIIGRFAKEEKFHVVDYDRHWDREDAEARLRELIRQQEREKKNGRGCTTVGFVGISTPYLPEYELKDLKIQSRQVSKWS